MDNPEFPKLTPVEAAQVAASLAAASCACLPRGSGLPELTAQRHFLAHYQFLLDRQWPDPAPKTWI